MPSNDKEIWEWFRNDVSTPPELDSLSYASYSYDKYEWIKRFQELRGREPNEGEINDWISQLPESRLVEIREGAEDFFDRAARAYMKDRVEVEKRKAVNQSILAEVRGASQKVTGGVELIYAKIETITSFKSTFLLNIINSIIGSFVFTCLIIIAAQIFDKDPSPFALFKHLTSSGSVQQLKEENRLPAISSKPYP